MPVLYIDASDRPCREERKNGHHPDLAAGAIQSRFAYEDCVDMRFAEQVVREGPPAI